MDQKMTPHNQPSGKLEFDEVEKYIQRVFPCTPPCDSFGACENCCEATLIRAGANLQKKQDVKVLEEMQQIIANQSKLLNDYEDKIKDLQLILSSFER